LVDGWEVSLSGQPQKLNGSLELLLKMFNNIGTNPMEQKFRKIKATNPTIKEKLFSLAGMGEFLQKLGFTHSVEGSDEFYVLDDSKLGILLPFIQHLRDRIALIEAKQDGPDEYQRVKNVIENQ
jgi:UBX domain-containing protein 6